MGREWIEGVKYTCDCCKTIVYSEWWYAAESETYQDPVENTGAFRRCLGSACIATRKWLCAKCADKRQVCDLCCEAKKSADKRTEEALVKRLSAAEQAAQVVRAELTSAYMELEKHKSKRKAAELVLDDGRGRNGKDEAASDSA